MKKIVPLDKSQLLGFRIDDSTKIGLKAGGKVGTKGGIKV
jgi:hypothetical protein